MRGGPGTVYAVVGYLEAGTTLDVVGRNKQGDWLVVKQPEGTAWISTKVLNFNFDASKLPEVEPPPTPIPPPPTSTERDSGPSGPGVEPTWTLPPP